MSNGEKGEIRGAARRQPGFPFRPGLALFLAMNLASGCSIIFVKGPPTSRQDRDRDLDCTTTYVPPVIDSILVLGPAYRTASAFGKSDADYKGAVIERPVDIGLGLVLTTLYVASAVYGYMAVSECSDAIAKRNEDAARQNDAWRQRVFRSRGQLPAENTAAPDTDAQTKADAAAQAKAFGDAARAASRPAAKPSESK